MLVVADGMCLWCVVLGWPGWLGGQRGRAAGGGGAAGAGADGFVQVVAGGPQVQFEVGFGVPVVQVAAEAGEQLGEDGFDDAGALPVEGFALGVSSRAAICCQESFMVEGVLPSRSR